jgi:hypothetical protein
MGSGTGVLAYIILWIVVPAAVTTSEKLEMENQLTFRISKKSEGRI